MNLSVRLGAAVCLAFSGYVHALLYVQGYRTINVIGPAFLLQASGSFAVALLLSLGAPWYIRLAGVGLAGGALAGFVLSRTVGVFGFVEYGWEPSPWALLSVLAEVVAVLLLAFPLVVKVFKPRSTG
jgi:hypothetical protein